MKISKFPGFPSKEERRRGKLKIENENSKKQKKVFSEKIWSEYFSEERENKNIYMAACSRSKVDPPLRR